MQMIPIIFTASIIPCLPFPLVGGDVCATVELTGADTLYWVGDATPVLDEVEEFITGARGGSDAERVLTTIVFTDIVGSTERAAALGDGHWRDLLDNHDTAVRHELERFRGIEVNTVGDGFVVLERLQNIDALSSVPVIVLSARDPQSNEERALKAGATAFFQKPADNDELMNAIRASLGPGQAQPAAWPS